MQAFVTFFFLSMVATSCLKLRPPRLLCTVPLIHEAEQTFLKLTFVRLFIGHNHKTSNYYSS